MELTPEQEQELQEKIKQMSPEELMEFQKQQCIFCQIVSGKVASRMVYDDEQCVAVLDINPANPGHCLLLPKEHYSIMPQIPEDTLGHIAIVAKSIAHSMLQVLKVQGTTIFVANGIAAGQRASHFMLHIIPRMEGDGIGITLPGKAISDAELERIKAKLLSSLRKEAGKMVTGELSIAEEPQKTVKTAEKKNNEKKIEKKKMQEKVTSETKLKTGKKEGQKEQSNDVGLDEIAELLTGKR